MSIAYRPTILLIILLFHLNGFHHLLVASIPTPNWRALIRLDPSTLDDRASDVLLTGWHSCTTPTRIKEQTNNCRQHFGAEPLKLPANGNPLGVAAIADECVCVCPPKKPVFLYSLDGEGKCVDKLENCQKPVVFKNTVKELEMSQIPLVSSPTNGSDEPILPRHWVALWKESSIKVRANMGVRCEITKLSYLGSAIDWQEGEVDWIRFAWADSNAHIFWNLSKNADSERIAKSLASSILRVGIQCQKGSNSNLHCMSFRLAGQIVVGDLPILDANISSPANKSSKPGRPLNHSGQQQGRLETILIILLAILLFLSVFGSIVLWNVCWRLKKSELISTLQMQFLYHIKQEKEKTSAEEKHRYPALQKGGVYQMASKLQANTSAPLAHRTSTQFKSPVGSANSYSGGVYGEDLEDASTVDHFRGTFDQQEYSRRQQPEIGGEEQQNGVEMSSLPVKRKLYFSAEFFEPHFMINPPQMAEQFLYDLRKMVAITKQRLLLRSRHIPRLSVILEEEADLPCPKSAAIPYYYDQAKFENFVGHQVSARPPLPKSPIPPLDGCEGSLILHPPEGSPKSVKSDSEGADSGVVSNSENSDCSTGSPPGTPPASNLAGGVKKVRQLVKGFESPPPIKTNSPACLLTVPTVRQAASPSSNYRPPPSSYFQPTTPTSANGSRIPVSKSPKLTPKSLSLAQPLSINANLGGSPIASNSLVGIIQQHNGQVNGPTLSHINTPPPPPPSQPPPPIPSSTIGDHANAMLMVAAANQQHKSRLAAQKRASGGTYAVFPSDSLKKSLPRRSKKAIAEARANFLFTSPQPNRTKAKSLIETKI